MKIKKIAGVSTSNLPMSTGASYADNFSFSFSGASDNGSGLMTGNFGSLLTSITGTINGNPILGFSQYGLTIDGPPGNILTSFLLT